MKRNPWLFFFLLITCFSSSYPLSAQKSSAQIYKDIQKFGVLANVLYVAAHPDDENTRMISYISNHLNAGVTYLSLTRGDGGQNLIGPEIREMLGIIRTHELLQAREIDGGSQMFTRANDFGYSKSATETFQIWDRDQVLSDVVWAMRKVRPDVVINRFSGDLNRPTHGHHTASAILAIEAFELTGDPSFDADQLKYVQPWQPRRIFFNTSPFMFSSREQFDQLDKSGMVVIDIGAYDAVTGQSNSEIAGRSRTMHKSQGFGSAETRGSTLEYLELLKDTKGTNPEALFEGIDITWNRVEGGAVIAQKVNELQQTFDFKDPSRSIPLLLEINDLIQQLSDPFWKKIKSQECTDLIRDCLGLFTEARTNVFRTSPGMIISVTLEAINRSGLEVTLTNVFYNDQNVLAADSTLADNLGYQKDLRIRVPDKLSIPYWLEEKPKEGMYIVNDQADRGLPADPAPMNFKLQFDIMNERIEFDIPLQYRTIDPAEGEIYRPVSVTPPVTIVMEDPVLVFSKGSERLVHVTLTAVSDSIQGSLQLVAEDLSWKIVPDRIEWKFNRSGESTAFACTITAPDKSAKTLLYPEIHIGSNEFHHTVSTLDYDHIPYMSIVKDATVELKSLDISTIHRPIAYIEGAGDDVDKALQQLGYQVDVLKPENIFPASLAKYQVIIAGVRAFNTLEELSYKNTILFDWVKAGGTLIVQYNTSRGLVTNELAPFPLSLSRKRVTEENAPVSIIAPDHPALNFPNKINSSDFSDWIQERGLYYPDQWDERFIPLLEMNDTGEEATRGSLLIAQHGEGYYIYSGLSWFRHLPAGVPGAYRLLSNLIALGYKNNRS